MQTIIEANSLFFGSAVTKIDLELIDSRKLFPTKIESNVINSWRKINYRGKKNAKF